MAANAVGYQACDDKKDEEYENPTQIIEDLVRLVNPTGQPGIVGVYLSQDPKGVSEQAKKGQLTLPWAQVSEGLSIRAGQAPVKKYNGFLRDMIIAGRARPSQIVTHRLPLDDAPQAYKVFDERGGETVKSVLKPGLPVGSGPDLEVEWVLRSGSNEGARSAARERVKASGS